MFALIYCIIAVVVYVVGTALGIRYGLIEDPEAAVIALLFAAIWPGSVSVGIILVVGLWVYNLLDKHIKGK